MNREIISGMGKGLKLCVLPSTPKSYWLGMHEPEVQAIIKDRIKPGMVVYDCGANVGFFSVVLAQLVGPSGRVYAFEPSPGTVACLRTVPELNGFSHLTVVPEAVSVVSGEITFIRSGEDGAMVNDHVEGTYPDSAADARVTVATVSLDDFHYRRGNPPPQFIKIDVEGWEGEALAGASRLIAEYRPILLLEIHGSPGRKVWELLRNWGYTPRDIVTGEVPRTIDEFAVWIRQYLATADGKVACSP